MNHHEPRRARKPLAAMSAAALLLAGCASFSPDGGLDAVNRIAEPHTGHPVHRDRTPADADAARVRTAELLARELSASDAIELALLNHRGLQASLADLGIAEADLVQAGRIANPSLRFGHLEGGGQIEIDRAVLFDVVALLTMPIARAIEQRRFETAQWRAADAAIGSASAARRAYFEAVAAQARVGYAEQVHEAAQAAGELAERMQRAGNYSALERMHEQAFAIRADAELERARQASVAARERLVRALGLDAASELKLPARLPELPAEPIAPSTAEQAAIDARLDVQIARRSAETLAKTLGLTQATRVVNVLTAGYANKSQTGAPRENGYEIELMLPLFDFGDARLARAEASYRQALDHAADVATRARSEVREAYSAYRTAWTVARRYRDDVVPLGQRISAENLLRYNAMQIGVFDLLADAREQIAGVTAALEAMRDYWLADSDLQTALTGHSPSGEANRAGATR